MINIFKLSQEKYNEILNKLFVVFAFTLPIKHYANSTMFFLILVVFLLRKNYLYYFKKALSNKIVLLFFSFVLLHYIYLLGSENFNHFDFYMGKLKYGLDILILATFLTTEYAIKAIYGFVLGVLVSEIVSYLIFFNIIPHSLYFYNEVVWNATPTDPTPFTNHIWYGLFLAFSVGIILYNIITIKKFNTTKMINIIFFITISINLSLQGSRLGYILYFSVILFTLFYFYGKQIFKYSIYIIISFILIFYLAYNYSNTFKHRINQTKTSIERILKKDYDSSFGKRVGFWIYSFDVIKEHPFGVGTLDAVDEVKKILKPKDYHLKIMETPHNEFIFSLLKFGYIGLILLMYLFYKIFTFKQENEFLNFTLKSGSFIVFISMLSIDYFLYWLIFFWEIIIVTSTMKSPKEVTIQYNKKEILFYIYTFIFSYISAFAKTFKYIIGYTK